MTYTPKKDDYVKWHHYNMCDEGWVYFVSDYYITIEVGVKCMDENTKQCSLHEKTHCLVVCHNWYWDELEYVTNRREDNENRCLAAVDEYKSQEYRYSDPQ